MEVTKETLIFIGITILVILLIISGLVLVLRIIPGVYTAIQRSSIIGGKILRFLEIFASIMYIPGISILYAAYIRQYKMKNN
ncbi:putative IMV membrane protein [Fowlpox virus]|nr:putative IMV membrane protein [Fowlpox virus]